MKQHKEKGFLVYRNSDKTYITKGNNITNLVGLKFLKASNMHPKKYFGDDLYKPTVKHIKQFIMSFSKMTRNGNTVDLTGDGVGFYNIPVEDIIEI